MSRCAKACRHAAFGCLPLVLVGCGPQPAPRRQVIGLSTSLPLIWGETGDIRGQLARPPSSHWAMKVLAEHGRVVTLDTLAGPNGLALPPRALLVLAQPRPLSPGENVALDTWVRNGGHVLLFVDSMLTAHSDFALGDPRRPETIAMLSPILRHWGIELQFDPGQSAGERQATVWGITIPVDLPGHFQVNRESPCRSSGEGVECRIGQGRVFAVADAAVFDGEDAGRVAALDALVELARR